MQPTDIETAIIRLVQERDPRYLRSMLDSIEQWNRVAPVRFVGELDYLNPVVEAMLHKPDDFRRLTVLVDSRRDAAGLPWMWPPASPDKFDRVANQRRIMRERRERSGRALRLENASRPAHAQLHGRERLDFERTVLNGWGKQLADKIARARGDGRLSQETIDRIRADHWAGVDAALDAQEATLRREGKLI